MWLYRKNLSVKLRMDNLTLNILLGKLHFIPSMSIHIDPYVCVQSNNINVCRLNVYSLSNSAAGKSRW